MPYLPNLLPVWYTHRLYIQNGDEWGVTHMYCMYRAIV